MPPSKVRSAYEALIASFQIVVEDANVTMVLSRPPGACFESTDAEGPVFKTCLWLKGWPHRRLGSKKRLDVAVCALETFDASDATWRLTKSTVYMNYLIVEDSTALLVQSLHYDFVAGGQEHHPLFHVQLTHELISQEYLRDVLIDLELKLQDDPNPCWVTTRIPTPDMTLSSVLYCLVADHLAPANSRDFHERTQSIYDRLPALSFDTLIKSLEKSSHFKSSHWYAHMRKLPPKGDGP